MPTTRPNTTACTLPLLLSSTVCTYLHSSAAGLSATRGGLTKRDGAGVKPDSANSSTSGATADELMFILSLSPNVATEQTNSPVSSALRRLSLLPLDENITCAGFSDTALKKLYGDRLSTPVRLTVEIQPIGRGATSALSGS